MMRTLPPLQLDGIEAEIEAEDAAKKASEKGPDGQVEPQAQHRPKKQKTRRVKYRFLTVSEWAIFAHGVGGVSDVEGHVPLHPSCWYYPPKGIPNGLYRDVIWHRSKYFYFYHGMSTIRWISYILQIIFGAVLTAIGSMSFKNGTPITILAAANTINAGILALLHNSGVPDRYRSDQAEFEEVEDHIKKVLDTGIVPEDMTIDQVIAQCFDLYLEAKTTIQTNMPATYTPSSVLQSGQRAPEPSKSGKPGQLTPPPQTAPGARNSVIASRIQASDSANDVAPDGKTTDTQDKGK